MLFREDQELPIRLNVQQKRTQKEEAKGSRGQGAKGMKKHPPFAPLSLDPLAPSFSVPFWGTLSLHCRLQGMKARISFVCLSAVVILLLPLAEANAANLLIQGATLIDGTGRAPIADARILIEGDVIRRIWSGAEAAPALPPGTQVVDARGKFVIPGLIDSHVHYRPYMGEMFLAHGVTTVYDLGNPLAWQSAVKKGLNSGKIRGPRFYFCSGITIGSEADGDASGGALAARNLAGVKTPADAKQAIAALKGKTDCVKLNEDVKGDFFTAIAREAHAAGVTVISHSLNAIDSATWGIDGVEHMTGVGISAIHKPDGRQALEGMTIEAGHKNSLLYQWMEPAVFDEMIQYLVKRNVFLNPTLDFEWKGIIDRTSEFELEDTRLLYNPLLQYMPLDERLVTLGQYHWADKQSPADRQQFLKGYRNVQDFLRRFVKAGGKLYSGTDSAAANTPGLSLHHEMQLYVDAGIAPIEALMSSTKWGAEILHLDKQLGTVEPGKLADMVILRANPLDDIRNTKAIDQVIRNGEIVDITYHSDYSFPFPMYGPESKHLYNPPPRLRGINPAVVMQRKAATLSVRGQGFVPNSVVFFGQSQAQTRWVSATELAVTLTEEQTWEVGTVLITVQSPKPGGGVSGAVPVIVDYP
jgi:hypothetical protein